MIKNKKAEAGEQGIGKIILLIIALLVLVVLILSVTKFGLVEKIKSLLPDFLVSRNKASELTIQQQKDIPYRLKAIECPSPDREIYLLYTKGLDDQFILRYNEELNIAQIRIWTNINTDSWFNQLSKKYHETSEWIIDPLLFEDFYKQGKIDKTEYSNIINLLKANSKEVFFNQLAKLSSNPNWEINLEPRFEMSKNYSITYDELMKAINDQDYKTKYEDNLKNAPKECLKTIG
jgi:hypothetical protein